MVFIPISKREESEASNSGLTWIDNAKFSANEINRKDEASPFGQNTSSFISYFQIILNIASGFIETEDEFYE